MYNFILKILKVQPIGVTLGLFTVPQCTDIRKCLFRSITLAFPPSSENIYILCCSHIRRLQDDSSGGGGCFNSYVTTRFVGSKYPNSSGSVSLREFSCNVKEHTVYHSIPFSFYCPTSY